MMPSMRYFSPSRSSCWFQLTSPRAVPIHRAPSEAHNNETILGSGRLFPAGGVQGSKRTPSYFTNPAPVPIQMYRLRSALPPGSPFEGYVLYPPGAMEVLRDACVRILAPPPAEWTSTSASVNQMAIRRTLIFSPPAANIYHRSSSAGVRISMTLPPHASLLGSNLRFTAFVRQTARFWRRSSGISARQRRRAEVFRQMTAFDADCSPP